MVVGSHEARALWVALGRRVLDARCGGDRGRSQGRKTAQKPSNGRISVESDLCHMGRLQPHMLASVQLD